MKIYIRFVAFVLLVAGSATPALAFSKTGDMAADFKARTLDGQKVKLSDLKGETLLLEMGASWCPSCKEEARQIESLRSYLKEQKITYVSVYIADSTSSVTASLKAEGLTRPDRVLIDSGEARQNYAVYSIPRLVLIDKNFKILFDKMFLSKKELQQQIKNHLNP